MFWNMNDYFILMKNLVFLIWKKVIDIGNVLFVDGYFDNCVILIVIS